MYNNRILIVDDEIINVDLLETILSKDNYVIEKAFSGEEALAKIEKFTPDVILLDVLMPGIDGYEVCRKIRNTEGVLRFTKIIIISGQTSHEEIMQGYNAGADDYITKPIFDNELLAKVRVFTKLKKAEEIDEIKSDLLNLFAHETKTPLNAIFGFAELLKISDHITRKEHRFIDGIMESGHQLLNFFNKTSLLCELKKGLHLHLSYKYFDKFIKEFIKDFEKELLINDLKVQINTQENILLRADWSLIETALEYLIENAIKYSPKNGTILISISNIDDKYVLKIEDQGKGIPQDRLTDIFNPFAIDNIMHHHKGQGLSLAITKQIIEHHMGTIHVKSKPDEGSIFTVMIPINN